MIFFVETRNMCPMKGDILYNKNSRMVPGDKTNRLLGTYYLRFRVFKAMLPDGTVVFEHTCGEDNTFANDEERKYCFSEARKAVLEHYADIKNNEEKDVT